MVGPGSTGEPTLDPQDWEQVRALGHRIIDDAIDFLASVRERRVWTPIPENIKTGYADPLPQNPTAPEEVYAEFLQSILPYAKGNIHPRFFSWVEGTGTFTGALADLLASVMNANCAIGDHSAMYIDGQVVNWCKEMLGYPREAGGLLVSGGSMANLSALAVAREKALETWAATQPLEVPPAAIPPSEVPPAAIPPSEVPPAAIPPSEAPPAASPGPLVAYGSTETHNCVSKALRLLGLGPEGFCAIPVDEHFRIRTDLLVERIHADRAAGKIPFCIIGNAGTVNTGAIDPLDELRAIARAENSWLHIDGAFGALAKLVPGFKKQLSAIEQADSVAFDLHKWMYMPYEVGGVLVRDAALQRRTFSAKANYLLAHERGLAAGPEAYTSKGIELSRGFKALKVWMSLKEHGVQQYARQIECNIAQAAYLGKLIDAHPTLELLAEVTMNIVCFRYNPGHVEELNALNKELLMQLHESGIAAPSYTVLHSRYAIRVAITNHRTRMEDMDILASAVVAIGDRLAG